MFLEERGYEVSYYIPNRQTEGYGLNKEAICKISEYASLLITVDTGIAAINEVEYANSLGLKVIITDHHECQEKLPEAYCIINPKRPDTTYPFESLAGVGVAFKLIHALALKEDCEEKIWKYIDIVALGTVADVVPLEGENRIITYLGFEQMNHTSHIGLKAMLEVLGRAEDKITSNLIGYQIGPRINAAGRISHAKIGVELLTTKEEAVAKKIAQLLDEENKKRQDMETAILQEALEFIEKHIDKDNDKVIVVAGENWHHGVIGIVASRIMNKYYKPTIVLTLEEGIYSGSARSVEGFNIFEALNTTKEWLTRFGGHEMAAGLSLRKEDLEPFKEALKSYGNEHLTKDLLTPNLEIDLQTRAEYLTLALCEDLTKLEPFGAANPTPLFAIKGKIQYAQKIGQDKHLKLSLQDDHEVIQGVGFDMGYLVDYLTEGEEVIVACEVLKNVWNNRVSVQIRIKDIQSTQDKIVQSKYYNSLYKYMKEPPLIEREAIHLKTYAEYNPITHKLDHKEVSKKMAVFTEEGLREVYRGYKNHFTKLPKVCYNELCDLNEKEVIIVNLSNQKLPQDYYLYEWDFKSIENYECLKPNFDNHYKQIDKMVPNYKDCKMIYTFFKMEQKGYVYLHKAVESLSAHQMTEYKLLQALDIFKELGLISYTLQEGKIAYKLLTSNKTSLEHSKRYMHLQKFKKLLSHKD